MGDKRRLLSRQALLTGRPNRFREVEAPSLGGTVLVRGLTGGERQRVVHRISELEGAERADEEMLELNAMIAGFGMVDEDGNQLFGEDTYKQLLDVDARAVDSIAQAVLEESGLTEAQLEELQGKSGGTPTSSSSSGWPSDSGARSVSS